jgi:ABC-2 type transport system ATP-binding protein
MTEKIPAIQTENLTRHFGNIIAVDHLSLHIPEGIIFGFLGPNGAGKTTTIRLLLGLLQPTEGKALIFGHDSTNEGDMVRELCGALPENPGLYERLSALDNLRYYADIYRLSGAERDERIHKMLEIAGIWERRHQKVSRWSHGMKQKLALVRAMLHRPRLLFLDEPTLGLDVSSAKKIREVIVSLVKDGHCTIFFTSHNLSEVEEVCERVAIIHKGCIIAEGTLSELKARGNIRTITFYITGYSETLLEKIKSLPSFTSDSQEGSARKIVLRLKEDEPLHPIIQEITASGALIQNIETKTQSLENVFLELTESAVEGQ